jgi:4-carboxymuconolactone decarboxylase
LVNGEREEDSENLLAGRVSAMKGLPKTFRELVKKHPKVWKAHEELTEACAQAGPLDRKTRELIKIGMSVGAGLETATQRHAVMAVENGATAQEIFQTVLMAMTTCGHPAAAAGWQWVQEALRGSSRSSRRGRKK